MRCTWKTNSTCFLKRPRNATGVDFGRVARAFDAIGAYTEPRWDDKPGSSRHVAEQTRGVIQKTRAAVGPEKRSFIPFGWATFSSYVHPDPRSIRLSTKFDRSAKRLFNPVSAISTCMATGSATT